MNYDPVTIPRVIDYIPVSSGIGADQDSQLWAEGLQNVAGLRNMLIERDPSVTSKFPAALAAADQVAYQSAYDNLMVALATASEELAAGCALLAS